MKTTFDLHKEVAAACPIDGVSVGDPANKATWRIDFKPEATQPQRDAAQTVVDAFVWDETPIDQSDIDNLERSIRALGKVVAQWSGKTNEQLKTAFRAAKDSLP